MILFFEMLFFDERPMYVCNCIYVHESIVYQFHSIYPKIYPRLD
jgi:hypothetical protein